MFSKRGHIFMKSYSLNIKLSEIIPNTYKNTSGNFQVISTIWRSYVKMLKLVAFFIPYPVFLQKYTNSSNWLTAIAPLWNKSSQKMGFWAHHDSFWKNCENIHRNKREEVIFLEIWFTEGPLGKFFSYYGTMVWYQRKIPPLPLQMTY